MTWYYRSAFDLVIFFLSDYYATLQEISVWVLTYRDTSAQRVNSDAFKWLLQALSILMSSQYKAFSLYTDVFIMGKEREKETECGG